MNNVTGRIQEREGGVRDSSALGRKNMMQRTGLRPLCLLFLGTMLLVLIPVSRAQEGDQGPAGHVQGNYNIQQTMEVGYRQDWISGNMDTYDTFEDLGSGIRLLDYTLNMTALNHSGTLFDRLNFSNSGYGGDPNDVSRLRIAKDKWYEFSAMFRRDKNFWDYNLLANPLNPVPFTNLNPVTNPGFGIGQSPHSLYLVRRMQDYDMTILPQSRVRIRLGYSRDVDEGPSMTTLHGATDFQLAQNFRMTTNAYHVGVDFRVLQRTTISYDQFLEYNKQDTSDTLANTPFLAASPTYPGTVPVDMGLDWYYPPTATTAPCASPFLPTGFVNTATAANCKMYQSYLRTAPTRNSLPTERVSFQSSSIKRLEMTGSASYSRSDMTVSNLYDFANEFGDRLGTNIRGALNSGPANAQEVFSHANFSAVLSLTDKVRLSDSVRYDQWQNPGFANMSSSYVFAQGTTTGQTGILLPMASFSAVLPGSPGFGSICSSPYTGITCPQHTATSTADVSNTLDENYLGQRLLSNTVQLEADFTKRISARIGYMYETRTIGEIDSNAVPVYSIYYPGGPTAAAGNDYLAARGSCANYDSSIGVFSPTSGTCTQNTDGSVTYTNPASASVARAVTTINEQVGIAGLTLRPMDTLRINSDFEFGYNDNSYTRIWPRQIQSYKVHVNYKPKEWATIDGAIDINENRDNVSQVFNVEHARTYSFSMVLAPNSKLSYTLGYNYTDLYLQTYICFSDTFGALTGPALPVFPACTISNSPPPLGSTEFYINKQHFAYADVMWKPVNRFTLTAGYSGTFAYGSENGSTLFLDPLQPSGTLAFNYHKPFASFQIDIYKGLSYKTTWNYYGYDSKTPVNMGIPVTNANAPNGMYELESIPSPNYNGSTVVFALQYAF